MGQLVKKNIHIFMLFKSASANRKTNYMAFVLYRKPFQEDKEKQAEIQYGYGTKVCKQATTQSSYETLLLLNIMANCTARVCKSETI